MERERGEGGERRGRLFGMKGGRMKVYLGEEGRGGRGERRREGGGGLL